MTSFQYFADRVPEGQFLCALCFEGKPVAQAWTDVDGQRWDECLPCAAATRAALEKELVRLRSAHARAARIEAAARALVERRKAAPTFVALDVGRLFIALEDALEEGAG